MTTIRFDASAATSGGQTTPITVDNYTVELGRGDCSEVGGWQFAIDQDGHVTLTALSKRSTFQNNFGGDVGTVMQLGDVTELRL